jgi:hypothetical protein
MTRSENQCPPKSAGAPTPGREAAYGPANYAKEYHSPGIESAGEPAGPEFTEDIPVMSPNWPAAVSWRCRRRIV